MKKIVLLCIVVLCAFTTYAQHTLIISNKNSEQKTPLAGATATIVSLNRTAVADSLGIATFSNIAAGSYQIKVSYVGLAEQEITVQVPQADSAALEVLLEHHPDVTWLHVAFLHQFFSGNYFYSCWNA